MQVFHRILGFFLVGSATLALGNITGSDLQNFNATTNGLDFVTVQSSETLGLGIFNLGLFSTYAVNTLPRYEDNEGRLANVADTIIAADFNVGMGVASFWDIGVSVPSMIYQNVNFDGGRGQFEKTGITEFRANSKWRLLGDRDEGIAFILSTNVNLTDNNPYVGTGSKPTLNYEMAFDTTINRIALGANIGFRDRSSGTAIAGFPIKPLQDQYLASVAASYLFTRLNTKIIFEGYGGFPYKSSATVKTRSVSAAEMLLGMKHDINDHLAMHGGLGTEFGNGTSSADWRIYTGINYAFGFEGKQKQPRFVVVFPKPKKLIGAPLPPKMAETTDHGPAEAPGVGDEVIVLRGINFSFDSASRVLPGTRDVLKNLGETLKNASYEKIIIEGHTDSIGAEQYNYSLGLQRAQMIREYMLKILAMNPNQVEARSYGEILPVADNGNYQGRQLNRRVVFRLVYKK